MHMCRSFFTKRRTHRDVQPLSNACDDESWTFETTDPQVRERDAAADGGSADSSALEETVNQLLCI